MHAKDLYKRLAAGYNYDPMYGELCNERDRLKKENAKLRQENQSIGMAAYEFGRKSMADENAKLRELVLVLWDAASHPITFGDGSYLRSQMRELGIEVDRCAE